MRNRLAVGVVTAVAAAAVPAGALAAGPGWTDAGAGVPASVTLNAVAAYQATNGDVVVAVGRDAASGQAAIYRYSSGGWQQDTIAGTPANSCLVAVAVDQKAAWAVGSQGGGCPGDAAGSGKALLVRFGGGGDALAAQTGSAGWSTVDPTVDPASGGATLGPATAVALSGTDGDLVTGSQTIYSFTDGMPGFSVVSITPVPSAVNGIALYGSQTGYAAGSGTGGADIFALSSSPTDTSAPFAPPLPQAPLAGVVALDATDAIAIEGNGTTTPGWWAPDSNGVWARHNESTFASATLASVAIGRASATAPVAEAVAGTDADNHGTVWQRTLDQSSFAEHTVACVTLHGVAVLSSEDMWAVGEDGTLLHYTATGGPAAGCQPPPAGTATSSGGGSGSSGTGAGSGSGSTSGSGAGSPSPGATTSTGTGPPVQVTVSQPGSTAPPPGSRKPTTGSKHKKRHRPLLIKDVRVSVERGQLVVVCRLTAPARVSAVASRAGRVVGRSGWHRFAGATCRLVVPYRGARPPAQLRIFALPLGHLSPQHRKRRSHNPAP